MARWRHNRRWRIFERLARNADVGNDLMIELGHIETYSGDNFLIISVQKCQIIGLLVGPIRSKVMGPPEGRLNLRVVSCVFGPPVGNCIPSSLGVGI